MLCGLSAAAAEVLVDGVSASQLCSLRHTCWELLWCRGLQRFDGRAYQAAIPLLQVVDLPFAMPCQAISQPTACLVYQFLTRLPN